MLNLDQVRLLEDRVEKAVGKIQSLTAENNHLRSQLSGLQMRVGELEGLVRSFKDDQGRIEEGILNALDKLSAFEDSVFNAESTIVPPAADFSEPAVQPAEQPEILAEEPAKEDESSGSMKIDAEWQDDAKPETSSDGQMDIF